MKIRAPLGCRPPPKDDGGGAIESTRQPPAPSAARAQPQSPRAEAIGARANSSAPQHVDSTRAEAKRKDSSKPVRPGARPAAARTKKSKWEEAPAGTRVDALREGKHMAELGTVLAASCASYSELWTAVGGVCASATRASARLVWQDHEGDWLVLLPDSPFSAFARNVQRILVVPNP